MQHDVTLLGGGLQVGQPLPLHQIAGAGDAAGGHGRRQVAGRGGRVFPLHAEQAVDPAVLVAGQAHVIDIGGGFAPFGHRNRARPELEVVHAVGTFRHGEEGFPVGRFHAGHQDVSILPLDGAAVEDGMDAEAFHQVGIGLRVEVVTPLQGRVRRRQDGMFPAFEDAVAVQGPVGTRQKLLMFPAEVRQPV